MIETIYQHFQKAYKVTTDSRKVEQDAVFFALKGENFDANDFAMQVAEEGKASLVVADRKGLKHETFVNLTSSMAKSMIWHAVQAEKAGQTIEGFVPRTKLPPYAPATERQKERLAQLVKDGFLPRISPELYKKMTHEQATEHITRGKLAEQRVARQAA